MAEEVSSRARRDRRRRQYLSLGLGELAAAAVFVGVALWHGAPLDTGGRLAVLGAVGPLAVVLVAAGTYWLLARRWVGVGVMPLGLACAYLALGVLAVILLAAGLAAVVAGAPSLAWLVLLLLVWAFGVVEVVNYALRRLAFPAHRWVAGVAQGRVPQLAADVRAALIARS